MTLDKPTTRARMTAILDSEKVVFMTVAMVLVLSVSHAIPLF